MALTGSLKTPLLLVSPSLARRRSPPGRYAAAARRFDRFLLPRAVHGGRAPVVWPLSCFAFRRSTRTPFTVLQSSTVRPRATAAGLSIEFEPAESAPLAAGASTQFTAWVRASKPGTYAATIDIVRTRDGAGASHALTATFTGGNGVSPDFNGDGAVDAQDLATLLNSWGACKGCPADLDGNGAVDAADLAAVLNAWG